MSDQDSHHQLKTHSQPYAHVASPKEVSNNLQNFEQDSSQSKKEKEMNVQEERKLEKNRKFYNSSAPQWQEEQFCQDYNSCLASINEESMIERYEELRKQFPEHFNQTRNENQAQKQEPQLQVPIAAVEGEE